MAFRTKEAELIEWLLDKPPEMSHIFQLRAALRVLPLLNLGFGSNYHKEWIDDLNLRFLVLGLAWLRTVLPAKCFDLTSASEIITLHGNPLDFPFSATIASIDELMRSRNKLTEILVRDINGILAASEAARLFGAKDGFDSKIFYSSPIDTRIEKFEDDFWYCIDYDKRRIDRGLNSKELATLNIWSVKSHLSLAIESEWNSLKRTLEPENPNLVNWFQWYEMVSNGHTPHSIESWLIDENSEFVFTDENWQKRVRHSIELIMMRVDPEQGELIPDQIENPVPENIVIPPPRPSAIEVEWKGDRLVLSNEPPIDDGNGDGAIAGLHVLKQTIRELVTEASHANIDRRIIDVLSKISGEIPDQFPSTFELHLIAHRRAVLDHYTPTVEAEWPTHLVAEFLAIKQNFSSILNQFPHWRDFQKNAASMALSDDNIRDVPDLIKTMARAMRNSEVAPVIDPGIGARLDEFNFEFAKAIDEGEFKSANQSWSLLRTKDQYESLLNILKPLAQKTLDWIKEFLKNSASISADYLVKTVVQTGEKFFLELQKSIINIGGKLGKHLPTSALLYLTSVLSSQFSWALTQNPWIMEVIRLLARVVH